MIIEPLKQQHITEIARLEKLCFTSPWSENSIASELYSPLSTWLVAVENGQVLGYVGAQTVCGETDMMNLAVKPEFRRKGIGRQLILALSGKLKLLGSHCLTLEVRASNFPAQKLYEKLGFVKIGQRPKYYSNPREDALILRKDWEL